MSTSRSWVASRSSDRHIENRADDAKPSDSGDLLNGVGSSSSLTSNASSVFSTSQQHKSNGRTWASTPLTSSESSPPKMLSPMPAASSSHRAHLNGSPHTSLTPKLSQTRSHDATPIPSPPRDRKSARPPIGQAKGYRAVWDPELDSKLGKEEKRKMKPKTKQFGTEVCLDNNFVI